jgi:hypothetical protein
MSKRELFSLQGSTDQRFELRGTREAREKQKPRRTNGAVRKGAPKPSPTRRAGK